MGEVALITKGEMKKKRQRRAHLNIAPMSSTGRIFKIEEAAAVLNMSSRTIRDRINLNEIKYFKVGREYRFTERYLEEFIKSKEE